MVCFRINRLAITASHLKGPGNTPQLADTAAPCYVGALGPYSRNCAYPLSTINIVSCHGFFSRKPFFLFLLAFFLPQYPLLQISRAQEPTPAIVTVPPHYEPATLPKPDFKTRLPRPDKPELGEFNFTANIQTKDGNTWHLRGGVVIEGALMVIKADEVDLNEETHDTEARGHVFFQHFERNEIIVCARLEYNTETQTGKFYELKGYTKTQINAHPGTLTSDNPFYFEGKWAERLQDKYILHDGMITGCDLPNPWWTLTGPKFDIVPEERALAYKAIYRLRKLPLFYAPFFYKSLKKEPRQSGFLTPNIGNSSTRGFMFGLGYYWAINRSYDVVYHLQDFTARGLAHHVEFRGKPTQTSDFDAIFYGVQDSGVKVGNTIQKQGGIDLYMTGHADLGNGWTARGNVNYLSSLVFRQNFTESYNEAIFSESSSVGYLTKHFDSFTFNTVVSRLENFQTAAKDDFILIRKLPEFQFSSRDHELFRGPVTLWGFFDSSAGLLYRREPEAVGSRQTEQLSRRAVADPGVVTAFHWGGLHLVPSFMLHEAYYNEEIENGQIVRKPLLRNAREVSFDLILPSAARVFKKKTWLGDQLKHVIEPRARYRYVTGISDYNDTIRYDQNDLFSNTNEVELSLVNRLYAKRGEVISEVFTWELSQKRYFDPTFGGAVIPGQRNVLSSSADFTGYAFLNGPRNYSPVASSLRVNPIAGISFEWLTDYDPFFQRIVNSSFGAGFRRKKYFVSAGHSTVRTDPVLSPSANQLRTTVGYGDPNRRGFNTVATVIYDYRQSLLTFATTQVNYNTDCCGISVQYRRFAFGTRNENQFRVAFSIANVGSFGTLKKQERLF
jgi:LPS-assembly protein